MHQNNEHPEQCPNCTSAESTVPIITINGITLWRCTSNSCSGERWRTETTHRGVRENPDPATVEKLLNRATEYWDEQTVQGIANDITRLYHTPQTPGDDSNAESVPYPQ